jgi:hypothetical protein
MATTRRGEVRFALLALLALIAVLAVGGVVDVVERSLLRPGSLCQGIAPGSVEGYLRRVCEGADVRR